MKKWIIALPREDRFDAGPKAREDAEKIALKNGYVPLHFEGAQTAGGSAKAMIALVRDTLRNVRSIRMQAKKGDLVVFQYPHYPVKTALIWRWALPHLKKKYGIRFAALVHDLNSLRNLMGWGAVYSDRHLLPQFDRVICHNEAMKKYLASHGVDEEKLITLEVFDYLTDSGNPKERAFDKSVVIAGNLGKSAYIRALTEKTAVSFHLYGNGGEELEKQPHAAWHGAYPPSELPGLLEGSAGLVWDGEKTDTCAGVMGAYMRINAPHKLSLYLAAGLPVIIWDQAAMAAFVQNEQAGWVISDLAGLPELLDSITEEGYQCAARNARRVGEKIRQGYYIGKALDQAAR